MLQKGFLREQKNDNKNQTALLISRILTYIGAAILILSFAYLFFNFEKADTLVGLLLPFLVAGLGLVFVGYLIKQSFSKLRR